MNRVILMGRLTRDPEIRTAASDGAAAVARYTLAVDRRTTTNGEKQADFIPCTAFGKAADFAEKYLKQGTKVLVSGRIQTGSYTNREGKKVYTTDVIVEELEFAESRQESGTSQAQAQMKSQEKTLEKPSQITVYAAKSTTSRDRQYLADFKSETEAYRYAESVLKDPRSLNGAVIIETFRGDGMETIALTPDGKAVQLAG